MVKIKVTKKRQKKDDEDEEGAAEDGEEEEVMAAADPKLDDDDDGDEDGDDDDEDGSEEEDGSEDGEDDNDNNGDEEEGGEAGDAGEDDEGTKKRKLASKRNMRSKARSIGYRRWASEAGLSVGKHSFGLDIVKAAISPADVRRMANFCPEIADGGMEINEFRSRLRLRDASLSSGPLTVLHTSVESFARNAARELVARGLESTTSRITASNVRSVLRAFEQVSDFEFVCPLGVLRHAQDMEKAESKEGDDEERQEEAKFAKANHVKILKEADKAREAKKAQMKEKRDRSKEQRLATTAAAAFASTPTEVSTSA